MLTLVYHADAVGPICRHLAALSPSINTVKDTDYSGNSDTILRWGSHRFDLDADIELNTTEAVSLARDKGLSRTYLCHVHLAPETWFDRHDIHYPCVIRPRRHHAGIKLYVCHNHIEARDARRRCGPGWYASELVDKVKEYRVFVFQGRIVAVSERFPAHEGITAWNLEQGGRLINVNYRNWPIEVCASAIKAAFKLDLDWTAVDVAIARDGAVKVFECNTAPGLRNPYTMSKIAQSFAWAAENIPPEMREEFKTFKQLRHPAIRRVENLV